MFGSHVSTTAVKDGTFCKNRRCTHFTPSTWCPSGKVNARFTLDRLQVPTTAVLRPYPSKHLNLPRISSGFPRWYGNIHLGPQFILNGPRDARPTKNKVSPVHLRIWHVVGQREVDQRVHHRLTPRGRTRRRRTTLRTALVLGGASEKNTQNEKKTRRMRNAVRQQIPKKQRHGLALVHHRTERE